MSLLDEIAPMTHTKALRASRWQRLVYRVTGRWPQSYVVARLEASDRDRAEIAIAFARKAQQVYEEATS